MNLIIVLFAKYLYLFVLLAAAGVWYLLRAEEKWRFGVIAILSGAIGLALTKLAGLAYYDPRPFVVHHVSPLIAHVADNGFPSDHTVLTMVVAFVVFQFSKPWGIGLAVASLLVGVSRIAALVHSPLDILASTVIAAIAVALARLISPWVLGKLGKKDGAHVHL